MSNKFLFCDYYNQWKAEVACRENCPKNKTTKGCKDYREWLANQPKPEPLELSGNVPIKAVWPRATPTRF